MPKIKLVAESFEEYKSKGKASKLNEQELHESSKASLQKFLKDPERNKDAFFSAFAAQFGKKGGDILKKSVDKIDIESKKKLAQQALNALEDSKKGYAWIKVTGGKITGAGALGVQKGEVGKELGQ